MKKHLIVIGMTLVLLIIGLSGCTEENNGGNNQANIENKFVGTWNTTSTNWFPILIFTNDGKLIYVFENGNEFELTYEVDENQITVKPVEGNPYPEGTWNYSFSNDDKTLTINNVSGGTTGVYTKQQ